MYQHFDLFWQSTTAHVPGNNIIAPSYDYEYAEHTLTGKHNRDKSWKQMGPNSICTLPILLHLDISKRKEMKRDEKRLKRSSDHVQTCLDVSRCVLEPSGQDEQYTSSTLQAPQAPQQRRVAISRHRRPGAQPHRTNRKIKHSHITLWYIMIHYDTLWYNMIHYDTLWYIMIHYDTLWYIMIHYDTLWYIMIHYDTLWYIMIHYDTLWYIMIHYDTLWYIMIHYDTLWYIMIH